MPKLNENMYDEFAGSNLKIYNHTKPFALECGAILPSLRIAYHTYGTQKADNVRWVCHALTASSDVADWWPKTVCKGGILDPDRFFTVCANMLGSCYGSSSAMELGEEFPVITFRDMARAHKILADHLGITKIETIIGGSTGGYQAMEWAYIEPERFERMVLLATLARSTAWITASSAAQRMAIEASGYSDEGLAAARAVAMLQYRGERAYNLTQSESEEKLTNFKADSYQRYQGAKLARRFDVHSYLSLLGALDSHDLGRGRGGVRVALGQITTPTLVVSVSSDIMYPPEAIKSMADSMPRAIYHEIHSDFGHDGFLVETPQISTLF